MNHFGVKIVDSETLTKEQLHQLYPTLSWQVTYHQASSPWEANVFTEQTSKGTFIRKNRELEKHLEKGINNKETWDKILADGGSVQRYQRIR